MPSSQASATVRVRKVETGDAAKLVELNRTLDQETRFMSMEPGERTTTQEQQAQRIADIAGSPAVALFVADEGARLAGFVAVSAGTLRRTRHTAQLVIGVRRSHWGQGLGTSLLHRRASGQRRRASGGWN
ncbi:GNAT family N-acetyltransferase [Xylophilus sp.]|uniref:GNAT family N-acetyltransferase n=1 Tax=Xylophilus sp. TaxID=2653893 RepID=UPI0013B773D1|nr:GNAT family N-acetyltransferase [Xylophilus sp.]KAF1048398.1 MAG: hypothetical protein GAK38_01410 [Xylophilus sp.]